MDQLIANVDSIILGFVQGSFGSLTATVQILWRLMFIVFIAVYGYKVIKRDGILSCCAHQIFFAANDLETASYVSHSCGDRTVKTVSTSQKNSFKYEPPGKNTSYRARPLISKEKVKQLARHEEIIITEASQPVRASKIVYYKDANFQKRILPPPLIPKLLIQDHTIPEFDIPKETERQKQEVDPNQIDIFSQNSGPSQRPTNLNDALKDEILDFHKEREEKSEGGETDSILDILRSAFK